MKHGCFTQFGFYNLTVISSVGVATGWNVGVKLPAGARNFSVLHRVQTASGAHSVSCPVDTFVIVY
jgi:hypothetical protein